MKTIITFLLTGLIGVSLTAQTTFQQLDSLVNDAYNASTSQWISNEKTKHCYDENKNEIERVTYDWVSGQWAEAVKETYTYDNNNNQTLKIRYEWNNNQWMEDNKREYSYDGNNNLIELYYYYWNNGQWVVSYLDEFTYDANENLSQMTRYELDAYSYPYPLVVGYIFKIEYSYDANNNLIEEITYNWESDVAFWLASYKYEYTYDADSNLTLALGYSANIYGGYWNDPSVKREYSYDADGNNSSIFYSTWDFNAAQWVNAQRYFFNYDNTYAYDDLVLPLIYSESEFKHKRTDFARDDWDENTSQWTPYTRGTYYYSGQFVGTENIVETDINVFPNPAQDEVVFDLENTSKPASIELYDAQGRLVDAQSLSNNKISVKHLNGGVYFYQLLHDSQQYGGRLIVK